MKQTIDNFTIKRINKGLKQKKSTLRALKNFTIKRINKGLKHQLGCPR